MEPLFEKVILQRNKILRLPWAGCSARKYWPDGSHVAGLQYASWFDEIWPVRDAAKMNKEKGKSGSALK